MLDNACWLATYCVLGGHGVRLEAADREVCATLERANVQGVLLYAVPRRLNDNYLFATYTSVRPWIGHLYLTPWLDERIAAVQDWITTGRLPKLLADVDILVVASDTIYPIDDGDWKTIFETKARKVLLRRVRSIAK